MAKSKDQQAELPAGFMAVDEHEVMFINTQASPTAIQDALDEQLSQLRAMIVITYGEEIAPLGTLPDDLQNTYIWVMARKVWLIQTLLGLLMSPANREQQADNED